MYDIIESIQILNGVTREQAKSMFNEQVEILRFKLMCGDISDDDLSDACYELGLEPEYGDNLVTALY